MTMAEEPRPRLGRGLAALLGDAGEEAGVDRARRAARSRFRSNFCGPIRAIRARLSTRPSSTNSPPRSRSKASSSRSWCAPSPGVADAYEIIAGERRWRAAQRPDFTRCRSSSSRPDDRQALEIAIIENVQRTDLNALEEAQGYEQLEHEFGYSQADLAKVIGKSRSHVANTLRLLKLPERTKHLWRKARSPPAMRARCSRVADPDAIAERIVAQGLSVRDVEKLAQKSAERAARKPASATGHDAKDADTRALEKSLSEALGLHVSITPHGEEGELRIRYKTLEQLDDLCRKLKM